MTCCEAVSQGNICKDHGNLMLIMPILWRLTIWCALCRASESVPRSKYKHSPVLLLTDEATETTFNHSPFL